jgi:hypothetical protein
MSIITDTHIIITLITTVITTTRNRHYVPKTNPYHNYHSYHNYY